MFEHLKWLSSAIDSEEEVSITDLTNGFPLLQVLSLISPASVDLSWNTTPEAQECPNISLRNYSIIFLTIVSLTKGLKYLEQNPPSDMSPNEEGVKKLKATISAMSQTVIHDAKSGQIEACVEILKNMRNVWKIAKVDQLQCSEEVLAEPERVTAYFPSCKSFLPMVRWLLHKTIVSLRNSNFDQILSEELEKALEMCSHVPIF